MKMLLLYIAGYKLHVYLSCVWLEKNPAFCICENKDADQLRSDSAADQHLWFHYTVSTIIPLLPKSEISSLQPSSVAVQPNLCRTWSETPKTFFFLQHFSIYDCFSDILWAVLCCSQPIQKASNLHRKSNRIVQREETPWSPAPRLCNHRLSLQKYAARYVSAVSALCLIWSNQSFSVRRDQSIFQLQTKLNFIVVKQFKRHMIQPKNWTMLQGSMLQRGGSFTKRLRKMTILGANARSCIQGLVYMSLHHEKPFECKQQITGQSAQEFCAYFIDTCMSKILCL